MGATLNMTARIRSLADGGQVFVSATTAKLVEGSLPGGVALVDLGPHRLRGFSSAESVFALAAPGVSTPPAVTSCPYPGLPAFERDDADRFFGREAVVAEVAERVRDTGFVAIVGASGSGKSSVVRAGLLATWGAGVVVTPGAAPTPLPEGPELIVVDQFEEAFTLCDDDGGARAVLRLARESQGTRRHRIARRSLRALHRASRTGAGGRNGSAAAWRDG